MRRTVLLTSFWSAFIFVVYLLVGLGSAAPPLVFNGDVCFKCRRVIDDARLGAVSVDRNLPTKYRTPGCLAAYVAAHPAPDASYLVTDYPSGGLIDASRAYFVPMLLDDRTGERDYRAYRSKSSAGRAAGELGVQMIDWPTLVQRVGAA
jgi:hypothetical protein